MSDPGITQLNLLGSLPESERSSMTGFGRFTVATSTGQSHR